jgi:hypothetical protein
MIFKLRDRLVLVTSSHYLGVCLVSTHAPVRHHSFLVCLGKIERDDVNI